jgi:hypothetical protein
MLEVGDVIKYRCEIGNLGEMTSTITGIVMEDENVLKLDDHGFVRYHGAKIRKLKVLVDGMLLDNPTSRYWRETGEFHLKPRLLEDYHTRKSSAAVHLSGVQKRFSDGISDWARKWASPQDLCHRVGEKTGESEDSSDEEDYVSPGNCNGSHSHDSTMESNNTNSEEEDTTTTMSSKKNYFKVVNEKSKIQTIIKQTAANRQKIRQWK